MAGNPNWKQFSSKYSNVGSEIKSHSSVLFNERLNAMFMMLDMESMDLEIKPSINRILKTRSLLNTIWRNIRPVVANNPSTRNVLNLNTKHAGIYTIDVGFAHIQECINHMIRTSEYNYDNLLYTVQQLQSTEGIIREVLQYFSYFIRTDTKQKPDINVASKKYEELADERTVEEFNQLLGDKKHILKNSLEIPITDEFFDDMSDELEEAENE